MRRLTKPIAFVAGLCFLMLQWSGLHVHADEAGYVGGPETAYTHSHAHHDHHDALHADEWSDHVVPGDPSAHHDYGDARDVSLLDQALVAFKSPLAILPLVFLFVVFPFIRTLVAAEIAYRVLSGRHTRWRPPLRAPPQPA